MLSIEANDTLKTLKTMQSPKGELAFKFINPESAHLCVDFQESLSDESKKTVLMRKVEDYKQASSGLNRLICVFNENKIVATSAAVRVNYGEHIRFHESSPMMEIVKDGNYEFIELSISMVHENFRGFGLQSLMLQELCERVVKLGERQTQIFTAACVLGNCASIKNIMNSGLGLCGSYQLELNGEQKDIVVFAKHPKPLPSFKEKEAISEGDAVISDKSFLESYLNKGFMVYSEGTKNDRKYYAVK